MPERNMIPLVSWFSIHLGNRGYEPGGGSFVTDAPIGVRLEIEEAKKSEPILKPEKGWEQGGLNHVQVMKETGKYRMWYRTSGRRQKQKKLYVLC